MATFFELTGSVRPGWRWGVGLLAALLVPAGGWAQGTLANASVHLYATVQSAPAQIRLRWTPDAQATRYEIYRKAKNAADWGAPLATFAAGTATMTDYADNNVATGIAYEYYVRKSAGGFGQGYVLAGIAVPPTEQRGTVVLLVDATHAAYLAADLATLESDLVGDGWQVVRHNVAASQTPPQVKALVRADYQADPARVKAVFIVGHVAVPYAGQINVDGHADHVGAWPADTYYGDMAGTWTDSQVNNVSASRPDNHNVPGDGKFDQSGMPVFTQGVARAGLPVGRVDLSRLPAFALPERDLLRRYLQKDHAFRHKQFTAAERGLIDDRFGVSGFETFANNGWRNFSALFGPSANTTEAPYFGTLRSVDYLFSYACGPGSYTGMGGVGSTADFASGPVRSVFNMQFGSYFGDWDNPDNYLRAALAADGYTLSNCWAGRPNWNFHQMGLGETIGYCTYTTQYFLRYVPSGGQGGTHVALLGDPTLRLHVVAPPTALVVVSATGRATLSWTASPDAALSYYVYRAPSAAGPFSRVSAQPVTATAFTDYAPLPGTSTYLVRAVQLKTGGSGSYHNLSQGAFGAHTAATPSPRAATWLGTQSTDWDAPANWSSGVVPTSDDVATVAATTPFAPAVVGGAGVAALTLAPHAQLTVAPGASLVVRTEPLLQPGTGGAATRLVLAPGTAAAPGGQLQVLDHATATAGLNLGPGTALAVGDYAELRLLGSFGLAGGTATFGGRGRLTFAHDPLAAAGGQHGLGGTAPVTVGVLTVDDARDTAVLNGPVQVAGQVNNLGTVLTNNQLTLLAAAGQQAVLAPAVPPGPDQARTLGTFAGTVGVQVYVDGSRNAGVGYRHLVAPVADATVSSLATGALVPVVNPLYNTAGNAVAPFPTVFRYAQERAGNGAYPGPLGFDQGWVSPEALTDTLRPGIGYTVHLPGASTVRFDGPVSGADVPVGFLFRSNFAAGGWQLLGNPYAAPLNWDLLAVSGSPRYQRQNTALYVFKSSGPYTGSYASYVPTPSGNAPGLGVNGGTNVVPVGQAFFVRSTSNQGSVRFSIDDLFTAPDATPLQRVAADMRPRLTLALRNADTTLVRETAIYFQAGATAGEDATYDAADLPGPGQALALVSQSAGREFSINGLPALTGADVSVPLRLAAADAGTYGLAAETLASLPAGYHAYLADAVAGTFTDLARTPAVAVTLPAQVPVSGRYAVLFTRQGRALATAPPGLNALVSLHPNPAHGTATLVVPAALRAGQPVPVEVRNALGRVVLRQVFDAAAPALELPLTGLAPGLYVVLVRPAAGVVSCRLVVD